MSRWGSTGPHSRSPQSCRSTTQAWQKEQWAKHNGLHFVSMLQPSLLIFGNVPSFHIRIELSLPKLVDSNSRFLIPIDFKPRGKRLVFSPPDQWRADKTGAEDIQNSEFDIVLCWCEICSGRMEAASQKILKVGTSLASSVLKLEVATTPKKFEFQLNVDKFDGYVQSNKEVLLLKHNDRKSWNMVMHGEILLSDAQILRSTERGSERRGNATKFLCHPHAALHCHTRFVF